MRNRKSTVEEEEMKRRRRRRGGQGRGGEEKEAEELGKEEARIAWNIKSSETTFWAAGHENMTEQERGSGRGCWFSNKKTINQKTHSTQNVDYFILRERSVQLNSFSNFICGFVIENESMKRSICRESEARDDRAAAEAGREGERERER